jgi:hypothetical protein
MRAPDLSRIIIAWPDPPRHIRAAVLELVGAPARSSQSYLTLSLRQVRDALRFISPPNSDHGHSAAR